MTAITERLSTALAGRYRIERHVGEGGMASVYIVEDLKHDRKVALNLLKPELAAVLGVSAQRHRHADAEGSRRGPGETEGVTP